MFADLKKYRRIFVTGPHRSGTTICAKMIAQDTGHDLVLEDDFLYGNDDQLAAFLYAGYGPQVIQCPFLAYKIHDMGYEFGINMDECLVVMMHRYVPHIIGSEMRARLRNGESIDFASMSRSQHARYHSVVNCHIAELRYEAWQDQCKVIPHAIDVGYESLRGHPLWIERRNFSVRQTDPNDEPDVRPVVKPMPEGLKDGFAAIANQ